MILTGRKPRRAKHKLFNPDFPLRHITHCASCDKPITGAFCKGNTKHYPRYRCPNSECTCRVSEPKADLEAAFVAFLRRLRPAHDVLADLPTIARKIWTANQDELRSERNRLSRILEQQKLEMTELVKMRSRKELSLEEFDEARNLNARDILRTEEDIRRLNRSESASEVFAKATQLINADLVHAWKRAKPEQLHLVQNLLFEGGLQYSEKSGFLNRSNSSIFCLLNSINIQKSKFGGPGRDRTDDLFHAMENQQLTAQTAKEI